MRRAVSIPRSGVAGTRPPCSATQRRFARVLDVRFLATHSTEKIQDRYREKLHQKAKERGLASVDALKEIYAADIQALRRNSVVPGANVLLQTLSTQEDPVLSRLSPPSKPQQPLPESQTVQPTRADGVKTLAAFIDVEKTSQLPPKEIKALWRLRHAQDPQSLCAVLPTTTFARMAHTARKHPQFILPLPRGDQGADIHFLQWTFPSPTTATVLFTHLADFKTHGEFAQPHTTVTHHLDLAERNGLVLLEGRVQESRGLGVEEGKWLLLCLQKFYGFEARDELGKGSEERRKKLMEKFSSGDEGFRVEELLEEAERVP